MTANTYVKFFPSDWRAGCTILSLEEEGLYIRSCNYMWDTGQALPGDDNVAARLLGVQILKYTKVLNSLVAKGKLVRAQGSVFNERVMKTIDEMKLAQAQRSARASTGHQNRRSSWDQIKELTEAIEVLKRKLSDAKVENHTPHHTPPVHPGVTHPVTPPVTPLVDTQKIEQNQRNGDAQVRPAQSTLSAIPDTREEKRVKGNSPSGASPSSPQFGKADALRIFEGYNQLALRCGLSQAMKLTPSREKLILSRLREYGHEGWHRVFENVERSAFLQGKNDRGWRADLDFLLQASSFTKAHDGRYGNGAAHRPTPQKSALELEMIAEMERAASLNLGADTC